MNLVPPALEAPLRACFPGVDLRVDPRDEMFHYAAATWGELAAAAEYFEIGAQQERLVRAALTWLGRPPADVQRAGMLDFASGFGRLTRHLVRTIDPRSLWISDIQQEAVACQTSQFGVHGFPSAWEPQALAFPRRFGLITVISLFTHLPRATFGGWLAALGGALADGGVLLFTTTGPDAYQTTFRRPLADEFVFELESESARLDPKHYGRTFCSPRFVLAQVAAVPGLEVLAHVPRGLNQHQDVTVVGRGVKKPAAAFVPPPAPRAHIDVLRESAPGRLRAEGWALQGPPWRPAARVELVLDGESAGTATLGRERPDLVAAFDSPLAGQGGWWFEARFTARPRHAAVRAFDDGGGASVRIAEFPA